MSKSKLKHQIKKKLDQLSELLNKTDEARIIETGEPNTWDSDTLYNLVENLKNILQLLEDKKHLSEKDEYGEPLIVETGLCSLVDEYNSEEETSDDE